MYKSKVLKIDSSKAKQYYNEEQTAFLFQLENPISVSNNELIVYSLVSAYIPYSFYSVNSNNNKLDVRETTSNVTTTRSVEIPHGNYSANEFSRTLSQLLNTSTITYHFVYNKINNTYSVSCSAASIFLFQTGTHASQSCHTFLGFPAYDTIINSQPFSTGCITMNDIYYFQINTDIGSNNIMTADGSDGIMDIIPISNEPMSFISYNPINPSKFLLMSDTLNNLKIALTDNKNRPVDLNGIPFMLTIRIDIVQNENAGMGREGIDASHEKTNLEYFMENPAMVQPATTVNVNDLVEYDLIKKMLKKVKKNKK